MENSITWKMLRFHAISPLQLSVDIGQRARIENQSARGKLMQRCQSVTHSVRGRALSVYMLYGKEMLRGAARAVSARVRLLRLHKVTVAAGSNSQPETVSLAARANSLLATCMDAKLKD